MRKSNKIKLESVKDKSTLVKLLANEDVSVTYQKVPTASFNIVTREVTLPIWKDKSEKVMDMMSLHEVGHALYTPVRMMEMGKEKNIKHSFLNVLEDVRIEKMIQDKYLGSVKVFKTAYKELIEKDFFGVKDKDLSKLNLIDRINMHFKNVPNVPFDDDELVWVKKSNKTKTSEDVINLAYDLQEWMKKQDKSTESDSEFTLDIEMKPESSDEDDGEDGGDYESNDMEEKTNNNDTPKDDSEKDSDKDTKNSETSDEDKDLEKEEDEKLTNGGGAGASDDDGIEATTDSNYMKKQYEAVDSNAKEINNVTIPKINLKHAIVDYKDINAELTEHYSNKENMGDEGYYEWCGKDVLRYKKEQTKTISYMVKEFEMKKTADLYKRSTVSKTGKLNMNTLHSYSYNEDIFLKMNVEPGATNHGLVMFVDWSGSMADNFHNTIKQTLNLVWFCKRVNIPFEVYGFTDGYSKRDDTNKNLFMQKPKQNDLVVNDVTLINMLSSRANKNDFELGLKNLWATSKYWDERTSYNKKEGDFKGYPMYPHSSYQLHSTPLNSAIVVAMDLIPKFKKDNGIEKVHTVFLTDGASNTIDSKYVYVGDDVPSEAGFKKQYVDRYSNDSITQVVDKTSGKKYSSDMVFRYTHQTEVLLSFLRSRVKGMSITNFFIAGGNSKGTISRTDIQDIFGLKWGQAGDDEAKKIQKEIKKFNVAVCKNSGWDEMYVLPGGEKLDTISEDLSGLGIEVGQSTKGDLKKAFGKMTAGRKNSRPLLNKFIGMIA